MMSEVLCNTFVNRRWPGYVLCTVSKSKVFPTRFANENVGNRIKTALVTLIVVNTRNLSKNMNVIIYELWGLNIELSLSKHALFNSTSLKYCYL